MKHQSLIVTALCAFLSLTTPMKTQAVDFDDEYREYVEKQAEKRNIRATMALLEQARAKAGTWSEKTLKQRLALVSEAMTQRPDQLREDRELARKVRRTQALTRVIVECSQRQAERAIKVVGEAYDARIKQMLAEVAQGRSQYCQPLKQGITQIPQQDPGRGFRALR